MLQSERFNEKKMYIEVNLLQEESILQLLNANTGKNIDFKTMEKQYPERFRDLSEVVEAVGQTVLSRAAAVEGKTW
jgi:hypothetical protein